MGLAAMEVRKMAEMTRSVWKMAGTRNRPSRSSVPFSGSESKARSKDFTMGARIPPARAVLLGMAGAIRTSLAMRE